jgi:hypothetical protein
MKNDLLGGAMRRANGTRESLERMSAVVMRRPPSVLSMASTDLLDEVLGWFGGMREDNGAWIGPTGLRVGACMPLGGCGEAGWHRWQMPGRDGITRRRIMDRDAPWVSLSPSGVLHWCRHHRYERVLVGGLLARCGYLADHVLRGSVAIQVGAL